MKYIFFIAYAFLLISSSAIAQIQYPPLSHKGRLVQQAGFTTITVDYERPAARQRKIFGELVPYGKIWRTGAGHSTVVQFSTPVFINNTRLAAGAYSLFTIPGEDNWTVIFNKDTSLVGAYGYDEKKDAVRFTVKPEQIKRFYESMTIEIDVVPHKAEMFIAWTNTRIQFTIDTRTDELVDETLRRELIDKRSTDWKEFNNAAFYYNNHNRFQNSMAIIHEGYKIGGEKECHLTKARALEAQGKYREAIAEVKKEMDNIRSYIKTQGGYDLGIALQGFEWYVGELEKKMTNAK